MAGTSLTLTATASSGLPVSFASTTQSICTVSGVTASLLASGACTIDASQAGNGSYSPAQTVEQSFTVNAESQTITFGPIAAQAVGTTLTLTATASSGLPVSFASTTLSVCTVSAGTASLLASGTCTITASQAGNTTYAAAQTVSQSFSVNAETQTIAFASIPAQTVGASLTLTATASSGLPVSFASTTLNVCTVNGAKATLLTAGTCTISASQAGNATYAAAPTLSQSFLVSAATQTASAPVFSPAAGTYSSAQQVTLSSSTPNAVLYYTADGSAPAASSTLYTGPIQVNTTETIAAIATAAGYTQSAVSQGAYTINQPPGSPTFVQQCTNSGWGMFVSCTLNSVGAGHTIAIGFATDSPSAVALTSTAGNPILVATKFSAANGEYLSAYILPNTPAGNITFTATLTANYSLLLYGLEYANTAAAPLDGAITSETDGWAPSTVVTPKFTTTAANDLLWTFCADAGWGALSAGTAPIQWTARDNTPGYFIEDGPSTSAGAYFGQVNTTGTSASSLITIALAPPTSLQPAPVPTLSPVGGVYTSLQSVTITDAASNATIYYTTDGSTPTVGSTVYSGPIQVLGSETIQAIAKGGGYWTSPAASATYTLNLPPAATPVFTPPTGTYTSAQTVTISDSTPGAAIYYTTDGSTPSIGSTKYTGSISVSSAVSFTEIVQAIAIAKGYSLSPVGGATYIVNLPTTAAPTFSPAAGTYSTAQTVTLSDSTAGATIYYTTDRSTPTANSAKYTGPIAVSASETIEAIASASGLLQSPVDSAAYIIGGPSACGAMSTGNMASLNGFVPFPASNVWNTNIANAAVDPNSAMITGAAGFAGNHLHFDWSTPADGNYGIPYTVVDSSTQPLVPINVVAYADQSDVANAPFPLTSPVEGYPGDCTGGPNNYVEDAHVLVLDRHTCFLYETFNTQRCNGAWSSDSETIWDLNNYNQRPYSWTSADAAGLPIFPGLVRYDEVASGAINHAIRFTLPATKDDANGGYFVSPATHAAGNIWGVNNIIGMRIRLKSTFDISKFSATNQVILKAMQQYGLILADNGSYFYFQGVPDSRWNDNDLENLNGVTAADFDVVQMTPVWPGWDANTAPTGNPPTIGSFTASASTVSAGTPVTLTWNTSNDSYDFIDQLGGVRGGSVTIVPAAYTTYTLYATNQYGRSSASVTVNVTGAAPPITWPAPAAIVYGTPLSTTQLNASAPIPGTFAYNPAEGTVLQAGAQTLTVTFTPDDSNDYKGATAQVLLTVNQALPTITWPAPASITAGTALSSVQLNATASVPGVLTYSPTAGTVLPVGTESISVNFAPTDSIDFAPAQASVYLTVNSSSGTRTACSVMSTGDIAPLNGFVPFPSSNLWNVNIANAAVDPNSAVITGAAGFAGNHLHFDWSTPADGNYGIPYTVVDSSIQPVVPITVVSYPGESDVANAPFPLTAPIEGYPADCTGGPNNYVEDAHVLVLDRHTCMLYETWNTRRCNGAWSSDSETIWDLTKGEARPYGWTSADAAGLPIFPGLVRYDEVAAGAINHAIRFTLPHTKNDANNGYFVDPATHAAGTEWGVDNVMGMRIRLKPTFDISKFSATNQVILKAMQQYGMILADNGSYFYFQGVPDSRWNDNDLENLNGVTAADFDVVQMTPSWPGWDANTAPTGNPPTINSFTTSASSVASGTPVTLTWNTSFDSYDIIDQLGGVRGPSVTVAPTATTTYTLYATNQFGRSSQAVTVTVH
jgi:hypothetical protein